MATQIRQFWVGFERVRDVPTVEQIGGSGAQLVVDGYYGER